MTLWGFALFAVRFVTEIWPFRTTNCNARVMEWDDYNSLRSFSLAERILKRAKGQTTNDCWRTENVCLLYIKYKTDDGDHFSVASLAAIVVSATTENLRFPSDSRLATVKRQWGFVHRELQNWHSNHSKKSNINLHWIDDGRIEIDLQLMREAIIAIGHHPFSRFPARTQFDFGDRDDNPSKWGKNCESKSINLPLKLISEKMSYVESAFSTFFSVIHVISFAIIHRHQFANETQRWSMKMWFVKWADSMCVISFRICPLVSLWTSDV